MSVPWIERRAWRVELAVKVAGRYLRVMRTGKAKKGRKALFFRARENVRWVSVEASGPRLGRSPAWGVCRPPAPWAAPPVRRSAHGHLLPVAQRGGGGGLV